MASVTVGFSLPEAGRQSLDHLVEHFTEGNLSPFLRLTIKHMEVLERAEKLDELAAYGADRLASKGLAVEDIPDLVKRVLSDGSRA